ncbi:MAG: UvrD-helicase domain-containing protein [Clostridiales bacterium]|nr:UvrD-helicase domain-containing protein [Clostridiales bacterium]
MSNLLFDSVSLLINDGRPFTPEQYRAITEDGNIIVSAGAGSGKTTVMIARIINKLLLGASLNDMLIVTFTRASAQDMRIKLNEKLAILSRHVDERISSAALAALEQTSTCNIGTLHSYCQKLVKQYFFAAEIDPAAVVCEEGEAGLIKRAAVIAAIERAKRSGDEYFAAVSDMLKTRRSSDGLIDAVSDIVDFALSTSDPDEYLDRAKPDDQYDAALKSLLADKRADIQDKVDELKQRLQANEMAGHLEIIDEFIDYIDGKINSFTSLVGKKFKCDTPEKSIIGKTFSDLRENVKKLREQYDEADKARGIESYPYIKALCAVARDAMTAYADSKAKQGKIDYSDLEHGAYRVLKNDECLQSVMRGVRFVFIDEFQDVNPLQNDIANLLGAGSDASGHTDGAETFVVGDVKQSIYGFRRCSPSHFKNAIARAENGSGITHIALAKNFRSSNEVVDFVNRVMSGVMTEDFGGVDYATPEQKLVCGRPDIKYGDARFVAVPPVEKKKQSDDMSGEYSVKNAAAGNDCDPQAKFIADSIVQYVAEQNERAEREAQNRGESSKKTDFKLSDIAVLMRSADPTFCASLAAELKLRGISYTFGRKSSVKSYPEAVALVDIARCVDNRLDDVALYTALRSPMGGFSDKELLEISKTGESLIPEDAPCLSPNGKDHAFIQKAAAYDGALKSRLDRFFEILDGFTKIAKVRDCGSVLGEITSVIDYFQFVYENGGQAGAVQALIDYASAKRVDLHAFLEYYDAADFELEADDSGNGVIITTIHSSKGLEYDFVIVADLQHRFNERDNVGKVIIGDSGVFIKSPDTAARTLTKSIPYCLANLSAPQVTRQEELRLLYVALTRAKRRLLCCCRADAPVAYPSPPDARRMLDFMRNIASLPSDVPDYSGAPADEPLDVCQKAVEAIKTRLELSNAKYTETHKARELPIKTCVTRVASEEESADEDELPVYIPPVTDDDRDTVGSGGADARLRGTAYHRAMELVDLLNPDIDSVKAVCENAELVNFDDISRAVKAVAPLVRNARAHAKEKYFIVDVSADELYKTTEYNGAGVLVQGVIDLFIIDSDGKAIIVDYKTGDPEHLRNDGYRTQLELYSKAVEKSTGIRVKRACLYSFTSGEFVDF